MDERQKFRAVLSKWAKQDPNEFRDGDVSLNWHPISAESKLLQQILKDTNLYFVSQLEGDGKTYTPKFFLIGDDGSVDELSRVRFLQLLPTDMPHLTPYRWEKALHNLGLAVVDVKKMVPDQPGNRKEETLRLANRLVETLTKTARTLRDRKTKD